jgi:hypothetical protein
MTDGPVNPLDEGIRALQSGDLDRADPLLNAAVAANPTDGRAHGYLGICKARRGDIAGSITSLQESARLQPSDATAQFNLAVALVQAQRTGEAREALQRVLTLDPSNSKALAALQQLDAASTAQTPMSADVTAEMPPSSRGVDLSSSTGSYEMPAPGSTYPPQSYPQTGFPPPGQPYPTQGTVTAPSVVEPSIGLRIARGIGWGFLCGQFWTALNLFWFFVWGGVDSASSGKGIGLLGTGIFLAILFFIVFGFLGSLVGMIIGAGNASVSTGAIIGVVAGLILCGLEFLMTGGNASSLVNVFFWFFTGRYVGANIAARVQQPVRR